MREKREERGGDIRRGERERDTEREKMKEEEEKEVKGERETDRPSTYWPTPQMATMTAAESIASQEQGALSRLCTWMADS